MKTEKLFIFGAGGHAKVIFDIVMNQETKFEVIFADDFSKSTEFLGCPVWKEDQALKSEINLGVIALGDNFKRKKVSEKILSLKPGFQFATLVHPTAYVCANVSIGAGTVVMPNATINTHSKIGQHCIVNTGAIVEHDNVLSDFASVAPRSVTGGNCTIGELSAVSIGATLIHGLKISQNVVIGANSCVTKSFEDNVVVYGVPAKVIKTRQPGDKYL